MLNQIIFFLLNGAGTLILETVWLKKQIAIFGTVPESYGSILFAYFFGVSAGSWFFRKHRGTAISPIVFYGGFIAAILLSLLLPLILLKGLPIPASFVYGQPVFYKLLVWVLAIVAIFPVCFFLGAFFPLIAVTVDRKNFVQLYGIQTFGALLGIYLGAFYLPYSFGYLATSIIGISVNILSLLFFQRSFRQRPVWEGPAGPDKSGARGLSLRYYALSFVSGVLSLILQVLWIRFISLGTDNSIYAFGSASLMVLLQLTIASAVTSRLPSSWFKNHNLFHVILLLSLLGIMVSARIYVDMTNGLAIRQISNAAGLFSSILFAAAFMVPGYFFVSFIFPFIMRQDNVGNIGAAIAANGIGCAIGSFVASFFFLPQLGIWTTLLISLLGYALFALLLERTSVRLLAAIPAIVLIFVFNPQKYPLVTPLNPFVSHTGLGSTDLGSIVSVKEGEYGIVSVIDYAGPNPRRSLWLNNTYELEAGGAGGDNKPTYRMGMIPTVLNPAAKSLAMIGVGTGIMSSSFLNSRIDDITLIELIPEVVEAASKHFSQFNSNVLENPRVRTVIDDGRHYLQIEEKKFDIICSDFFTPWGEGTAYLYTVDHFKNVKNRLKAGGLFCLWLPAFQLTKEEFLVIAKSFASVFPHTTVWQSSIGADNFALIGSDKIQTEQIQTYMKNLPNKYIVPDVTQIHLSGIFQLYLGPVVLTDEWKTVPLNTLDRPVIEFLAAQSNRKLLKGEAYLLLAEEFIKLPGNPDGAYFTNYDITTDQYRFGGYFLNLFNYHFMRGNRKMAEYYRLQAREALSYLFQMGTY